LQVRPLLYFQFFGNGGRASGEEKTVSQSEKGEIYKQIKAVHLNMLIVNSKVEGHFSPKLALKSTERSNFTMSLVKRKMISLLIQVHHHNLDVRK
jgi:hypothetical protein